MAKIETVKREHPTRRKLLDTVYDLLKSQPFDSITIGLVLEKSGVVSGSLYYHFENFDDLVETAMAELFSAGVKADVKLMEARLRAVQNREELFEAIREILEDSQADYRRPNRFLRARLLALAESKPRLMSRISAEQARVTDALAGLLVIPQDRGWLSDRHDARVIAAFMQAYTFGKLTDEVSDRPVDQKEWTDLVMEFFFKVVG